MPHVELLHGLFRLPGVTILEIGQMGLVLPQELLPLSGGDGAIHKEQPAIAERERQVDDVASLVLPEQLAAAASKAKSLLDTPDSCIALP